MFFLTVILLFTSVVCWYLEVFYLFYLTVCLNIIRFVILKYKRLKILAVCVPRDIRFLFRLIKPAIFFKWMEIKNKLIHTLFKETVEKFPNKVCFIFENKSWTFKEVNNLSNKIANVFSANGYKKGDVVGLFMENRGEYIAVWLGLSKIGVITALVNTNLKYESLLHSFNEGKIKGLIFSSEGKNGLSLLANISKHLMERNLNKYLPIFVFVVIEEIKKQMNQIELYYYGEEKLKFDSNYLKDLLESASDNEPKKRLDESLNDHLLYIYTSGTTGLPKASIITQRRYILAAPMWHNLAQLRTDDVLYTAQPLYHASAGQIAVGHVLVYGSSVLIKKKFSAKEFFPDCRKYNCTVAQYIGEICRYILTVPPNENDKNHKLRLMLGNGLRPQIWAEFTKRFNIPRFVEFYGATEGNAYTFNTTNKLGSMGFLSPLFKKLFPTELIKADENGNPIRDKKTGFCIRCEPGDTGLIIGRIDNKDTMKSFAGYLDKKATEKKILKDVLNVGDLAFNSGDLAFMDEYGYLYFRDRLGDTYRWKGENVSTNEIEGVISKITNFNETISFGVQIEGFEGRAGMIAIVDSNKSLDIKCLSKEVNNHLPNYARPLFLRILQNSELTGTFKLKKNQLKIEGFNINIVKDPLYFLDPKTKEYMPLTKEKYESIINGNIRI